MSFPSTIDTFREIEDYPGVVVDPERKDTVYAADTIELQEAAVAIEETLGINPQGVYSDVAERLETLATSYETLVADMMTLDAAIAALKLPVGSLYYNADSSTNPATLLGYGTWAAFGQGRVIVGKATSGTFATNGATGGAETHTLTTSEMPSHAHTAAPSTSDGNVVAGGVGGSFSANLSQGGGAYRLYPGVNGGSTGGGGAHNNLQPYIVVYAWKRTA